MLAIRMQRTGRSGHAQFRVIVQEARLHPTSGKVVAWLGNYDPHSKAAVIEKDKAAFYLEHGAQPSDRVVRLLKKEGVKLPKWVRVEPGTKKRSIRNPDKLRRNRPEEEAAPEATTAAQEPAPERATESSPTPEAADTSTDTINKASDEAEASDKTEASAQENTEPQA